jgi:aspartyl aminopeptidase
MAHAYQPNFPHAYEPNHHVMVNAGPVIKTNSNQRYSTSADTAARFMTLCESAGVPFQHYTHRTDLGCGSTIGPIIAHVWGGQRWAVDVGDAQPGCERGRRCGYDCGDEGGFKS